MSFYGSTYYQLVDTFSKFILNNALSINDVPSTSPETIPVEADTRDSTLKLSGGNKWIVLENGDNKEIKISHGSPGNSIEKSKSLGWISKDNPNANYLELQSGDEIETSTFRCDNAGHIIPSTITKKTYQLPISDIEGDISELETIVDSHTQNITELQQQMEAINVDGIKTDINTLNESINTVNKAYNTNNATSILGIGDKDFPTYFGKLDKIKSEIEDTLSNDTYAIYMTDAKKRVDGQSYSVIEGRYNTENLSTAFELLSALISIIGEKSIILDANATTVDLAIKGLKSDIDSIENRINDIEQRLEQINNKV